MEFAMFEIEKRFKLFGRKYQVFGEHGDLKYVISGSVFSRNLTMRSPDGLEVIQLVKQSAWFRWKYNAFDSQGLLATLETKNKKLRSTLRFVDEGRDVVLESNLFGNELTFMNGTDEVAKASRQRKLSGKKFGLAVRSDFNQELFVAATVLWAVIKAIKKQRSAA